MLLTRAQKLQGSHACVGKLILPEGLALQVTVEAPVGKARDKQTDHQHDKVPGGTQQLWWALDCELCCSLP